MRSNKNIISIILVVAVAFLLGMQFNSNTEAPEEQDLTSEEGKGGEKAFDITDVGASDGGDAGIFSEGLGKHTIRQTNDIYTFDSVSFTFTDLTSMMGAPSNEGQEPQIQTRLHFNNFRRNGNMIDLASFSLGVYQGECSQLENISNKTEIGEKIGFVQCSSAKQSTNIIVAQQGKVVTAYSQTIGNDGSALEPLHEILSVDISQLVE